MSRPYRLAAVTVLGLLPRLAPAQIQHDHHEEASSASDIGRVAFPTSCSAKAQAPFERGIALLHSFWYEQAAKEFDAAAAVDPGCAMAQWGRAMSLITPLWAPPDSTDRRKALDALNTGRKTGSPSDRERAYIDALAQYYEVKAATPNDTPSSQARMEAYRNAMENVARRFPNDDEAKIFFALTVIAAAPSGDTTFTEERRADSILMPLAVKYPTHPGVMHYIIHANDNATLAPLAVDAARRYAKLAPAIPHAQHMPSHIFIDLGLWDDVIASNVLATASGTAYQQREKMKGEWLHNLHTMDFLQYGYLQEGRDREAQAIVDKVFALPRVNGPLAMLRVYQALFGARQYVERGQWRDLANLTLPIKGDSTMRGPMLPWSNALLAYVRALGATRIGDVAAARTELARLDDARKVLAGDTSLASHLDNLREQAQAWLELDLGNADEAVRLAHHAAITENNASETGLLPAAEWEGDLLLAAHRPAEARDAYQRSLRRSVNRARSIFGEATAVAQMGDAESAKKLYAQYVALMHNGDGTRAELASARKQIAAR